MPTPNPSSKAMGALATAVGWVVRSVKNDAEIMAIVNGNVGTLPFPQNIEFPAIGITMVNSGTNGVLSNVIYDSYIDLSVVGICAEDTPETVSKLAYLICNLLHDRFNTNNSPVTVNGFTYGTVTQCEYQLPVLYSHRDKEETIWQYAGATFRLTIE